MIISSGLQSLGTPRRFQLRQKSCPTMGASHTLESKVFSLFDHRVPLQTILLYVSGSDLMKVESTAAGLAQWLHATAASALWCSLCASAGVTVDYAEGDIQTLKAVYRIAGAFSGELWELKSQEEAAAFIKAGRLALAASQTGHGPGVRVSNFHMEADDARRLQDLATLLQSPDPFPGPDDFHSYAEVQLEVSLPNLNKMACSLYPRCRVTLKAEVALEFYWEDGEFCLCAAVSCLEETAQPIPQGYSSAEIFCQLDVQAFALFPIDHMCKAEGIRVPSGTHSIVAGWIEAEINTRSNRVEISEEMLAIISKLVAGHPIRCLLVQAPPPSPPRHMH